MDCFPSCLICHEIVCAKNEERDNVVWKRNFETLHLCLLHPGPPPLTLLVIILTLTGASCWSCLLAGQIMENMPAQPPTRSERATPPLRSMFLVRSSSWIAALTHFIWSAWWDSSEVVLMEAFPFSYFQRPRRCLCQMSSWAYHWASVCPCFAMSQGILSPSCTGSTSTMVAHWLETDTCV